MNITSISLFRRSLPILVSLIWAIPTYATERETHRLVAKGEALMQLSRETQNRSLYHEAEHLFEAALKRDPQNVDAMLGMAWVENSEHAFDEGDHWARKALAIDSEMVDAYSLLGDSAVESGDYEKAYHHYQKAIDLRPDLSTYSRSGHLVWLTGDPEKGKYLMRLAISAGGPRAENTAWCRAQLGMMLYCEGNLEEAVSTVERAIADDPRNAHVLATMGLLRLAEGNREAALALFERSVARSPNHTALSHLVDLYEFANREAAATATLEKLLAFHTSHHSSHHHRSDAHSIATMEVNAEREHSQASAELALFWAERDTKLSQALEMAKRAHLDFSNIGSAHALAWTYYKMGAFENARHAIDQALKWNPPYPKIYIHAAKIYEAIGDRDKCAIYRERSKDAIAVTKVPNAIVPNL